jgi:hypothetical protein
MQESESETGVENKTKNTGAEGLILKTAGETRRKLTVCCRQK